MLHEVGLSDYEASVIGERYLMLGTRGSYGIERLHVTADESWRTLAILSHSVHQANLLSECY